MLKFKEYLNESQTHYFNLGRQNISGLEDELGELFDSLSWEGDVVVVPHDVLSEFTKATKKLKIKLKKA